MYLEASRETSSIAKEVVPGMISEGKKISGRIKKKQGLFHKIQWILFRWLSRLISQVLHVDRGPRFAMFVADRLYSLGTIIM
jgi:hypothetical protein